MSAYANDPRVAVNPDGTLTVSIAGVSANPGLPVGADGTFRVTYDPAEAAIGGYDIDEAIRSLIGGPQ